MQVERKRPWPPSYVDYLGRGWPLAKLDTLLAEPSVRDTVQRALMPARSWDGTWNFHPGAVVAWARRRYRREETVALFLLLAVRFFDGEVAAGRARRGS